jgi:hypothetical protein
LKNIKNSGNPILGKRPKELQKIFEAKLLRRKKLSKLSFKKKIEILVELQKMASKVERKKGRLNRIIWDIETTE